MKFFSSKKPDSTQIEGIASEVSVDEAKPGLFSRLSKTRNGLFGGISKLLSGGGSLDPAVFDEIEDQLLVADLGVTVSQKVVQQLKLDASSNKLVERNDLIESVKAVLLEMLLPCESDEVQESGDRPSVVLMVGVNGVGKTTTLAKVGARQRDAGKRVMFAACDTFRAAAIDQLQSWGERLDIPVIAQSHGADAAAVAFDAYNAAKARKCDLLFVDTAGRQHTHGDLVEQLKKVKRVLTKADPAIPDEVWLTVDAGNGQNILSQVEHFHQAVNLTGLCVTKLDGTAKGGVVFALAEKFKIPIQYIGTGESAEDLRRFNATQFVDALFPE